MEKCEDLCGGYEARHEADEESGVQGHQEDQGCGQGEMHKLQLGKRCLLQRRPWTSSVVMSDWSRNCSAL